MIDHVSITVGDLQSAAQLYDAALAPLGLSRLITRKAAIGYGKRYPEFWLNWRAAIMPVTDPGAHICLRGPDEQAVRAFHSAALGNGATDGGAPGPRPAAVSGYYGAFIVDPDGNKVEALTFPRGTDAGHSGRETAA